MFKPFWQLVRDLHAEGRGPKLVAVENVYGAITSIGGRDFATLAASFSGLGYRFGAVVVDAVHFLPQSRPRFFIIGISRLLKKSAARNGFLSAQAAAFGFCSFGAGGLRA
jgi:site-specific DNA-cytosine methylase